MNKKTNKELADRLEELEAKEKTFKRDILHLNEKEFKVVQEIKNIEWELNRRIKIGYFE